MTGPEHYREAEWDIDRAIEAAADSGHEAGHYLARAQVHATLAVAAATMTGIFALTPADGHEWRKALDPEYAAGVTP